MIDFNANKPLLWSPLICVWSRHPIYFHRMSFFYPWPHRTRLAIRTVFYTNYKMQGPLWQSSDSNIRWKPMPFSVNTAWSATFCFVFRSTTDGPINFVCLLIFEFGYESNRTHMCSEIMVMSVSNTYHANLDKYHWHNKSCILISVVNINSGQNSTVRLLWRFEFLSAWQLKAPHVPYNTIFRIYIILVFIASQANNNRCSQCLIELAVSPNYVYRYHQKTFNHKCVISRVKSHRTQFSNGILLIAKIG